MAKKKQVGRPKTGEPIAELHAIRVLKSDWKRWKARAKKLGVTISERIRQLMNEDCEK